jgi:outer membrane protein assembly complex protein YaeT
MPFPIASAPPLLLILFSKIKALVALAAAILLLLALVLLQAPPLRNYALEQARQQLRERYDTDLRIENLDLRVLGLRASAGRITLRRASDAQAQPFFTARRAAINVGLSAGLTVSIESGEIDGPRLHVVIDEDGRSNLPRPPPAPPSGETGLPVIPIAKFQIRGATLLVDDRQHHARAELNGIRVDADTVDNPFAYRIRLSNDKPGELTAANRTLPVETLELTAKADQAGAITIESARIAGAAASLTSKGTISAADPPNHSLHGSAVMPPALIDPSVKSPVSLEYSLQGPSGNLVATAKASGTIAPAGPVTVNLIWNEALSTVELTHLTANGIQASGRLSLSNQPSTLTARIRNLDLAPIARYAGSTVIPAAHATGTLAASWPGLQYQHARASLDATLSPAARPGAIALGGALHVQATAATLGVELRPLIAYGTQTAGTIRIARSDGTLAGQFTTRAANVATIPGVKSLSGPATLEAKLGGTAGQPTLALSVEAPALTAGTLTGVALQADASYAARRVDVAAATVEWRGQTMTGTGVVDLRPATPVIIASRVHGGRIALDALLAGFGYRIPAAGTLRLTATATGPWNRLKGAVDVTASELSLQNETLGTLAAHADLDGSRIHLTRLDLRQPDAGTLEATGTLDLDSRLYTARASASNFATQYGTVKLEAAGEGTVDEPAAEGTVEVAGASYRQRDLGTIRGSLRLTGESAHVDLTAPRFNAVAKGNIAVAAPYDSSISISAANTDLALLDGTHQFTGAVTAAIEAFGPLQNPRAMSGRARIDDLHAITRGADLRNSGPIELAYDRERLTVDALALRTVNSTLTAKGTLPLTGRGASDAIALDAKLDLAEWAALLPQDNAIQASGTLAVAGRVTGSLERLDPTLDATLSDGFFDSDKFNVAITQAGLQARLENGTLRIARAEAAFGPAAFKAQGDIPLAALPVKLPDLLPGRGAGPARFEASLTGLQLRAFRVLPEEVDSDIDIVLKGQTPDVTSLEALTGSLDLTPRGLAYGKFPLQSEAPIHAGIANGIGSIAPFLITGPQTRLEGRGSVDLRNNFALKVGIDGSTDAELVSLFTGAVRADGDLALRVSIAGTPQSPLVTGHLELARGAARFASDDPGVSGVSASNLDLRLDFEGNRMNLSRIGGQVNGGALSGSGGFVYAGGQIRNANLTLAIRDIYLDAPAGLRTRSNAELRLLSPEGERGITVAGTVRIQEGSYTDDINLDEKVVEFFRAGRGGVELLEEHSPFLEHLRFAVDIETEEPLILENNIGEMQLNADLRLGGTYYRPAVTGRITAEEGGTIRLQSRNFDVERAGITFTSQTRIEPALDIVARTRVKGKYDDYDIELNLSGGGARKLETRLTSEPVLPEPDVVALLTTGKTLEELRGGDVSVVARDQALTLLAGAASDRISSGIERVTGLSTVRIEPNLISTESTPGARLTVGQNLTRELELIYSMNLAQSNDQIWIADYAFTRRFNTRAIKQADNSYRGEFRHDLRFGGIPETTRTRQRDTRTIGAIRFESEPVFSEAELTGKLELRPGRNYDFFQVRKDLARLRDFYAESGHLEARLQVRREAADSKVSLVYAIQAGPRVDLVFENADVPRGVRTQLRGIWTDGLFDIQRTDDVKAALRRWLASDNRLAPVITHTIRESEPGRKEVVFDVNPGPQFAEAALRFPGASAFSEDELRRQLDLAGLKKDARTEPAKATAFLRDFYLRRGYLDVNAGQAEPVLNTENRTAEIRFPVEEGALYRVESVAIEGNESLPAKDLLGGLPIQAGGIYSAALRDAAVQRIEQQYWKLGYNDLDVHYEVNRGGAPGLAVVRFLIAEGPKSIIREVGVEGTDHTSAGFVKRQILLDQGLPLDLDLLGRARRNLYDTGAYSLVEIEQQPVIGPGQRGERDVSVRVRVRERRPFQVQYGAFYDTDRGPGIIADFTNRNSLGNARVIGIRTRYDGQIREVRGFFSQPYLQNIPAKTNFTGFLRREVREGFTTDRRGAEFIQEVRLKEQFLLNYGFRFENTRVFEREPEDPDFAFDSTVRIAPFNVTGSRDTRDDLLDATRGSFLSQSFELAPFEIRNSLRYWRYFGQYFKYHALTRPAPVPLQEGIRRPRVIYAGGVRAGVGRGIGGQDLIISERFFAGGGTSMRGFSQDSLGPVDFFGDPTGGEAVFLTNHELRFPMFWLLDGVGFVDAGNVYRRAGDFTLGDLRKSAGVGLRVRTPYFLLRLDWGFKLDRKPGEPASRFFFSIGQAF